MNTSNNKETNKRFNLSAEEYSLYSSKEGSDYVARVLNDTLEYAFNEYFEYRKNGKKHTTSWNLVWNTIIHPVLDKFAEYGTRDTEVRSVVEWVLHRDIEGV